MKIIIKILLLILLSHTGFSQKKSLSELTKEIHNRFNLDKANYIILSRTISTLTLTVKENEQISNWENHYILFIIIDKLEKTVVEEYQDGNKSKTFEINNFNIFKLVKHNFRSINVEKLNDFEYEKDGSKVHLAQSNSGEMEIDVVFNQATYHNKFDEFLLEFSSNSKLKLVKLISRIEDELKPYYEHHPFYVKD
ncbi:hypothetical protein [Flavobacterium sp.]|uniref:hypothetical protein n=1 Tax=Flavobacterium sp. TaxID=239 RepID=UPI0038FC9D7C